jgi:hypothetical protein
MATQPAPSDFERLKQLSFEHLLPAHGAPVHGGASVAFAPAIQSMLSG